MKRTLCILLSLLTLLLAACGSSEPKSAFDEYGLTLSKTVRNDKTGNWRIAKTASSLVIADHAVEYYNEFFEDDSEIHFVINFTTKTTTRITSDGTNLYVTVFEYVDGEEHDANILPSGQILAEYIVDIKTGNRETL